MILIGYQGIGKSTISSKENGFLNLESGSFWVEGVQADNWYISYSTIAEHLSEQGYSVFTSSHLVVRNQLRNSSQRKIIICPELGLEDFWVSKLEKRYNETQNEKNYKAYMNAKERYAENIQELLDDKDYEKIVISCEIYDLAKLINEFCAYAKCPFCGGEAVMLSRFIGGSFGLGSHDVFYIRCKDCKNKTEEFKDKEEAKIMWSRRV